MKEKPSTRFYCVYALFIPLFLLFTMLANTVFFPWLEKLEAESLTSGIITPGFLISVIAVVIFQYILVHKVAGISLKEIFLVRNAKAVWIFFAVFTLVNYIWDVLPFTEYSHTYPSLTASVGAILETFLTAYVEEFIFRGFFLFMTIRVFIALTHSRDAFAASISAVILSSVVFGIDHYWRYSSFIRDEGLLVLLFPAAIGLVLGTLYYRSANLPLVAFVHATINIRWVDFPLQDNGGEQWLLTLIVVLVTIISARFFFQNNLFDVLLQRLQPEQEEQPG